MTLYVVSKVVKPAVKDPKVLSNNAQIAFICKRNHRYWSK